MARSAFLSNLRTAAGFLSPDVQSDFHGDQAKFARVLKSAPVWLTPRAVEDYEETEFSELSVDDREQLSRNIAEFVSVARDVPPNQPASSDQVRRALPAFLAILEILRDYLDRDAVRAHQLLDDQTWPDYVVGFYCVAGDDSDGKPGLWTWVVVTDDVPKRRDFGDISDEVRQKIRSALSGIPRWPYVRFRAASEVDSFYVNA